MARRHPIVAFILLVAMLLLPAAVARGASNLPATSPQRQATPGVTIQGPGQDTSGIYLNKFDCGGTYGGDLNQLLQNCTVVSNVTFDVFGPNLQQTSQGGIALEVLPAGPYRIREQVPGGYGDPIAFCGFAPSNTIQPPLSPVVVYDGTYEFELAQDQSIYCDWFNVRPGAPADRSTLYVNKHFCPPVAEFDPYSATIYELAPECQEPPTPIPFSVTRDGTTIADGTAQGAPNALAFTDLAPGTVSVIEELPDGYGDPIVYCSVKDQLGNARAPTAQAPVDNDRILWKLNPADMVFCDWFNVPSPLGTTISVAKYTCPESVGYDRSGFDDYAAACGDATAGVSFKLDGASTGNPGEQLTDANGQVTWSEMEADHYFLTEEVPSGYGAPVVFCSYYLPAALQERDWQSYAVSTDHRIEFDVADGQSIVCSWFNVSATHAGTEPDATPDAGTGATPGAAAGGTPQAGATPAGSSGASTFTTSPTLTIRSYRCAAGYDVLAEDADPVQECTERPDDLLFELATTGTSSAQTPRRANTGGAKKGEATFTGVASGDYRLTQVDLPTGDTAVILTCRSNRRDFGDYPFAPFALVASDGSVRLSLAVAETLVCDWYNAPGAGLTVQVYACGNNQPSVEACNPAAERVRFILAPVSSQGNVLQFETDETGVAHLSGLAGAYTLSQVGRQPCAMESTDIDADRNITLSADRQTVVNVFNCTS